MRLQDLLAPESAARVALGYVTSAEGMLVSRLLRLAGRSPAGGEDGPHALDGSPIDVAPAGRPLPTSPVSGVPRVSVIMPLFNALRSNSGYLREALESVAAQSYGDLELIVVDDGSTDASMAVVDEFSRAHPELDVRTMTKVNGGQSSARNAGATLASGEWLAFLDQDDVWLTHRLESVSGLLRDDFDLVYTDADTVDASGGADRVAIHRLHGLGGRHPITALEDALCRDVFVMPGVMTIRASFFRSLGGFDESLSGYEDDDLFVRSVEAGRIGYEPVVTLKWRLYDGNYSQSHRMIASRLAYWRKLLARYGVDVGTSRRITRRFFREFLLQCSGQLDNRDELARDNLSGARELLPYLGPVDQAAFFVTSWAWTRRGRSAFYARWWMLNGMAACR